MKNLGGLGFLGRRTSPENFDDDTTDDRLLAVVVSCVVHRSKGTTTEYAETTEIGKTAAPHSRPAM